jgi:hypothetical protein
VAVSVSAGVAAITSAAPGLFPYRVIVFHGSTHALIPLCAVGVFTSFTLSQSSMVRRWLRLRPAGWGWTVATNAVGAATTGTVLVVVAATTFMDGAWIVCC